MKHILIACFAMTLGLVACAPDQSQQIEVETEDDQARSNDSVEHMDMTKNVDMSHAIPSHLEFSTFINLLEYPYQPDLLAHVNKVPEPGSKYEKGLKLGVYGVDLGYMNVYGKSGNGSRYIKAIGRLAQELEVGYYFRSADMERLAFKGKIDSLTLTINLAYNQSDHYLRSVNEEYLSSLIQIGTFIESMHIATTNMKITPKEELKERIVVQKATLDNLVVLLSKYDQDEYISDVSKELGELKKVYNKIEIIYTYGDPIHKEVDGRLVVEDNTTMQMNATAEQLDSIYTIIHSIRTKITGQYD